MNTIKFISLFSGLLIILVFCISATKYSPKEHFIGDMGIPTKDVDDSLDKVPNTVFYKELPGKILVKLFPELPLEIPYANVANYLAEQMNERLHTLPRCINTSNTLFSVIRTIKVSNDTLRIVLHREGKMFAIVIDVTYDSKLEDTIASLTSIDLVGYLSEYDVTSWPGYDKSTSARVFPDEFAQTIIKDADYEKELVDKQQYGIKADRGISG